MGLAIAAALQPKMMAALSIPVPERGSALAGDRVRFAQRLRGNVADFKESATMGYWFVSIIGHRLNPHVSPRQAVPARSVICSGLIRAAARGRGVFSTSVALLRWFCTSLIQPVTTTGSAPASRAAREA